MTKQNLKRLCFGLLLAISCVFSMTSPVHARKPVMVDAEAEMSEFCKSFDEYKAQYADQSNCWVCNIFMMLFNTGNRMAGQISSALAGELTGLVIAGGLLWLSFCTLMHFSNVGGYPDATAYLTKVGTIMLRVAFGCAFLAGGASLAFSYIINPILTSGVKLASSVNSDLPSDFGVSSSGSADSGVAESMKGVIEGLASSMAKSQSIAQGLQCGSMYWRKFELGNAFPWPLNKLFKFSMLIPNPLMWAVGTWLGCVFWLISILFCFAMIDVICRLCLVVAIAPIFIAAWVFPMTMSYAKAAFDMLLNTVLVFFVTALTAKFIVIMSDNSWGPSSGTSASSFNSFVSLMQGSSYVEAWDSLFDESTGKGIVIIFIATIMAWWGVAMAPKSDSTAKNILGGSFSSSCAIKAIRKLVQFIIDVVMLIISIISFGLGSIMYALKFFQYVAKMGRQVKKIQDAMKKVQERTEKFKKMQEKLKKAQERQQRVQKRLDGAMKKVQSAQKKMQRVQKGANRMKNTAGKVMSAIPDGDG